MRAGEKNFAGGYYGRSVGVNCGEFSRGTARILQQLAGALHDDACGKPMQFSANALSVSKDFSPAICWRCYIHSN